MVPGLDLVNASNLRPQRLHFAGDELADSVETALMGGGGLDLDQCAQILDQVNLLFAQVAQ